MMTPVFLTGPVFDRELRLNAREAGVSTEQWLLDAIASAATILAAVRTRAGSVAVLDPDGSVYTLDLGDVEAYRRTGEMAPMECLPEDLGGHPPGATVKPGVISDDIANALASAAGASSPGEAICYATWYMLKLARTLRVRHPQGEPGLLWGGVFRSMARRGLYIRVEPSELEPATPAGLSIELQIVAWLKSLSGCPEFRRVERRANSPAAAVPVIFGRSDGQVLPQGNRVPRAAMDELPNLTAIFMGPTKTSVTGVGITHLPSGDGFVVRMEDVLVDPAPLADAREFLETHPSSILMAGLGVVTGRPPKSGRRP